MSGEFKKAVDDLCEAEDWSEYEEIGMSEEEIDKDIEKALNYMKAHVGEWSVDRVLVDLTSWGFWRGNMMVSIDYNTGRKIIDNLEHELRNAPQHFKLEAYEMVARFASDDLDHDRVADEWYPDEDEEYDDYDDEDYY